MRLNILNGIRYKTALTLACLFLVPASLTVFGQNPQSTENKADQTLRSTGRVNPSTLGMEFDLPLGSYPGRGINVPISMSYSSKLWRFDFAGNFNSNEPGGCSSYYTAKYAENSASGWTSSLAIPYIEYVGKDNPFLSNGFPYTPEGLWCVGSNNTPQYVYRIMVHLPGGETHELRAITGASWNNTFYSTDSSNLKYVENSSNNTYRLLMPDGSYYDFATGNTVQMNDTTVRKGIQYSDRNGNFISYNNSTGVWTDTLGRTFNAPFGLTAPTSPTTSGSPITYSMPGMTGSYKFQWKYLKGSSQAESGLTDWTQDPRYFGSMHQIGQYPWWQNRTNGAALFNGRLLPNAVFNPIVLTEIELPTGAKYKFKYDLYGRIERIDYPAGGEERFTYSQIAPLSYSQQTNMTDQANYGVTHREVYETAGSGTPYEWDYSITENGAGGYKVSTTSPDGTISQRFLHRGDEACVGCEEGNFGYDNALAGMAYEERQFSSTGVLLARKLTHWTKSSTVYSTHHEDWSPRVDHQENYTYDSSGNGVYSTTKYEYEGDLSSRAAPVLVNKTTQWGFQTTSGGGSITPAATPSASPSVSTPIPSASPVRTTESTYLINDPNYSSVADNYTAQNIMGLVTVSKIKDSAGRPVSQSITVYDEPEQSPGYKGNPTTIKTWDSTKGDDTNSSAYIMTNSKFDTYGHEYQTTDARGNTTTTAFDSTYHAFPIQVTSPVPDSSGTYGSNQAFVTTASFDAETGLPLATTDPNGLETRIEYDSVTLRPRYVRTYFDNALVGPTTETVYNDEPNNFWVKDRSQIDEEHWAESITYLDGLGRGWKSEKIDSGGNIVVEQEFDDEGRSKRVSNPYRAGESKTWTTNTFDNASRLWKVTSPDSNEVVFTYGISTSGVIGVTKSATDQAGKKRKGIIDALGNMVRVIEDPDSQNLATDYVYDALGNLRKTTQGDQIRYFAYDSLGRLLRVKQVEQTVNTAIALPAADPVTGNNSWTAKYEYDDSGNVVSTTDAKNNSIEAAYDRFNRITLRNYSDSGTPDVAFYYDGKGLGGSEPGFSKGKTTKVTSAVSENRYTSFDNMGRVLTSQQLTTPEQRNGTQAPYTFNYSYNLSGALLEETYPSGRVVKNSLDQDGRLTRVQSKKNSTAGYWTYADAFKYNFAGAVTKMQLGNGHWETASFNERQQVTQMGLGRLDNTQDLLKLEYKYNNGTNHDNNGSMREQKITVPTVGGTSGFTATQTYTYDSLNRIESASETISSAQTWKQSFSYDRYGNRRFDTSSGATTTLGSCAQAICNPTFNTANNRIASGQYYTYDANGNVTEDANAFEYAYDAENRQKQVKNDEDTVVGEYLYDGVGKRVKKNTLTETTIFVYDAAGTLSAEYSTALAETPRVSYLTTDHLGSPRVITDQNGAVTSRKDFAAFGDETITSQRTAALGYNPPDVRQDYTGYQKDGESGLEYAQARYYNPGHGRFMSVDPLTASATIRNPQTFNRYSYALNSPYKFTDPLGLRSQSACTACGDPNSYDFTNQRGGGIAGIDSYDTGERSITEVKAAEREAYVQWKHEWLTASGPFEYIQEATSGSTTTYDTVIVAYGESGEGEHNTGTNNRRAAEERKAELEAEGKSVLMFAITSITGFQGLLDTAADPDYGVYGIEFFGHGSSDKIYIGNITSDYNKITMDNVKKLVNTSQTLIYVQIYACYTGAKSNGIANALAKQLGVAVWAPSGGMIFSSLRDKPTGVKIHPSTGPTYLVNNGGKWIGFNSR